MGPVGLLPWWVLPQYERNFPMDDSMFTLFDFISLAAGAYVLYTWYRLLVSKRLFANSLLIPKDQSPKNCDDPDGYIRYILPRLLVLGLVLFLFGAVSMANSSLQFYSKAVGIALNFVTLAVIAWYAVCSVRAFKRFW